MLEVIHCGTGISVTEESELLPWARILVASFERVVVWDAQILDSLGLRSHVLSCLRETKIKRSKDALDTPTHHLLMFDIVERKEVDSSGDP
jgi:hypothetical protein